MLVKSVLTGPSTTLQLKEYMLVVFLLLLLLFFYTFKLKQKTQATSHALENTSLTY